MKLDSEIKQDVEDELRWDPNVDATDIAVTVKSGVVMLAGFAKSYSDKYDAETAAKRVVGVVGLANDIEVQLPGSDERPDPEIARDAVAAVKGLLGSIAENIKVVIKNGSATLEGSVEWQYQRGYAETAVRRTKGLRGVVNSITVKPRATPSEIKHKIEDAFRRNAQIDAGRVVVEAQGSEVVLRGTVRSWAEREAANHATWAAPGVMKVDNRITVSP